MTIANSELPVLDIAYLDDMRGWIGDDVLASLLEVAPESFAGELASIETNWQAADLREVQEAGHRLKGAAGSVACRRLSDAGQTFQLLPALDQPGVIDELRAEVAAAKAALAEYCTRLTPAA